MNKDQVKGRLEEAKGSVKETVDKAAGKSEARYGDAKDKVSTHVNKRRSSLPSRRASAAGDRWFQRKSYLNWYGLTAASIGASG